MVFNKLNYRNWLFLIRNMVLFLPLSRSSIQFSLLQVVSSLTCLVLSGEPWQLTVWSSLALSWPPLLPNTNLTLSWSLLVWSLVSVVVWLWPCKNLYCPNGSVQNIYLLLLVFSYPLVVSRPFWAHSLRIQLLLPQVTGSGLSGFHSSFVVSPSSWT